MKTSKSYQITRNELLTLLKDYIKKETGDEVEVVDFSHEHRAEDGRIVVIHTK